jgi:hypothetical protein
MRLPGLLSSPTVATSSGTANRGKVNASISTRTGPRQAIPSASQGTPPHPVNTVRNSATG